jgi:hypothetical protein
MNHSRDDMNRPTTHVIWLGLILAVALCTLPALAQDLGLAEAGEDADPDTVALQRLVVHADGTEEWSTIGSQFVTLQDGSEYWIDLDELEDPDGNKYAVIGDAYQSEEDGPVTYEVRLRRFEPTMLSDEEIRQRYLEVHLEADEADADAFMARRELAAESPAHPRFVDPELESWLAGAAAEDTIELVLVFAEQAPPDLPTLDNALLEEEPAAWMLLQEDRLLAIETHKTALFAEQDSFLDEYAEAGTDLVRNYWVFNGLRAWFTAEAADALIEDSRIQRVEVAYEPLQASNTGTEILEASQLMQYFDDGYDGHRYSYRNPSVSDIYGMIFDTSISQEHPAWKDGTGPDNRLLAVYRDKGNGFEEVPYTTKPSDKLHGCWVATQFVADLTDDQDPNYSTLPQQLQKTGTTTETVFTFVMSRDTDIPAFAELAKTFNVDIVNLSFETRDYWLWCDANHSEALAVNSMMHDGIFVVASAGNQNKNGYEGYCTAGPAASASGAFTVAAYDVSHSPLNDADIESTSSRGEDVNGRPIVGITAASGREGTNSVGPGTTYSAMATGTSFAAPLVAGASADLKDFLIDRYGANTANHVGLLHANLLVMGDGKIEDLSQTQTTPVDPRWGVGRMRMRLFNDAGMDSPWRYRWGYWTHDHGELYELPINYNHNTHANDPVHIDVEWLRAALWFHEPNLGSGVTTSEVSLAIREDGTSNVFTCDSTAPQSQRLWMGEEIRTKSWTLEVDGLLVPPSLDSEDPLFTQMKRRMFLVVYFEDRDRDDEDGPEEDIL